MIFQKINFVDIKNTPVGPGQESRLETPAAFVQGGFQVQSAQHPIFGGPQRQGNHRHRPARHGQAVIRHLSLLAIFAEAIQHLWDGSRRDSRPLLPCRAADRPGPGLR